VSKRKYEVFNQGYWAAREGKGLSDCPYGGEDAVAWRDGVKLRLEEEEARGKP
jgi:hypothetical protein